MNTNPPNPSGLSRFAAEMKRRHVVRFALGYAAAAFVVLQLAEIVFPAFGVGETGLRILVVAVALLFPPALVLAWVFDITARGIERTPSAGPPDAVRAALAPRLALLAVTVGVVAAVGLWLEREGVFDLTPVPARGDGEVALAAYDPEVPIRSLAVLPLDDFSDGEAQPYFTAGLQEELIAQLSQVPGLRVVSRTSVQRFAGGDVPISTIGRELRVDAVIEGSVRRSEDQVRITVQLIHAASDTHVWTQQYDRSLDDVLALQGEVALDIARQIQAEVTPEDATVLRQVATRSVDPEAQDAYLRGRYEADKGTPEGLAAAKDLLESAVQEDSSFAPALAKLAGTRVLIGLSDSTRQAEEFAKALDEARKAVAMDSTSQEAWDVLRVVARSFPELGIPGVAGPAAPGAQGAGGGTHPPGRVVVGVAPVPPATPDTAWFQAFTEMGRMIEEQVRMRRGGSAVEATGARFTGARGLMAAGRFEAAAEMLEQVVESAPTLSPAWDLLARARISAGDVSGAVGVVERWSAAGGDGAPGGNEARALRDAVARDGAAGYWRWELGRLESRAAAGEHVSPTDVAAARAGSGDAEGAFRALEEAVAGRDRGLSLLHHDPVWDHLRADPRFADVVRRSRSVQGPFGPPRGRDGPESP